VSYASPTYYADRLCERGRCYLREWFTPDRAKRDEFKKKKSEYKQIAQQNQPQVWNAKKGKMEPKPRNQKVQTDLDFDERDKKTVDGQMYNYAVSQMLPHLDPALHWSVTPQQKANFESTTMYWM
jgi:eukaryotic translation initiation factor 2C